NLSCIGWLHMSRSDACSSDTSTMARGKRSDTRYLRQRGNIWFFQKRLSPSLAQHLGKTVLQQTTGTGDLDEACRVRDRLLVDLSDLEAELKGNLSPTRQRERFLDKLEKLRAANEELAEQNPEGNIPLTISEVVDPEKLSPIEREALRALNEQ